MAWRTRQEVEVPARDCECRAHIGGAPKAHQRARPGTKLKHSLLFGYRRQRATQQRGASVGQAEGRVGGSFPRLAPMQSLVPKAAAAAAWL